MSLLLRIGFFGFLILASIGTAILLLRHGTESVQVLYQTNPRSADWTVHEYFVHLDDYSDRALILLGPAVMITGTMARVLVSSGCLLRGKERLLGGISIAVVAVIVILLLVARYPA